jgi:hypothetical protein
MSHRASTTTTIPSSSVSTSGEWFTAKKRGRDDEQIQQDRDLAVQQRQRSKNRHGPGMSKTSAKPIGTSTKQTKGSNVQAPRRKKKVNQRSSLDTLNSIDDFEERKMSYKKSTNSNNAERTTSRKNTGTSILENTKHNDSDSDDDIDNDAPHVLSSFFPKTFHNTKVPTSKAIPLPNQKRTSTVTKMPSKQLSSNRSMSIIQNPYVKSKPKLKPASTTTTATTTDQRLKEHIISLENSDSDSIFDVQQTRVLNRTNATKPQFSKKKQTCDVDDNSKVIRLENIDSDSTFDIPVVQTKVPGRTDTTVRQFSKKKQSCDEDSEDDYDSSNNSNTFDRGRKGEPSTIGHSKSSCTTTTVELEDTPNVPQAILRKNKLKPYQPQQPFTEH